MLRYSFLPVCPDIKKSAEIESILNSALESADPYQLVNQHILLLNDEVCKGERAAKSSKMIILVAMGKASLAMTQAAVDRLGGRIKKGVCICKSLPKDFPHYSAIQVIRAGHPIPDQNSLAAGKAIFNCLKDLTAEDLVLVLISGGASALVASPADGISLEDLIHTNQVLLASGANINEVNTVRKHLEKLKGGGLLRAASPANVDSLVLSDVIGNEVSAIASGPTAADPTTFQDAIDILQNRGAAQTVPNSVVHHLARGVKGLAPETVKPDDPILKNSRNFIIGSNALSVDAALSQAESLGFKVQCVSKTMTGEARDAAQWFLSECQRQSKGVRSPWMGIAGGETTVTVKGRGKGGRNLEAALAVVSKMENDPDGVLITLATDGEDGPTDAAGAVVTAETMKRARELGFSPDEYLRNNDAYSFFEKAGGLIQIGSTGTNVNDLTFYFKLA